MNVADLYDKLLHSGYEKVLLIANSAGEAYLISSFLRSYKKRINGRVLLIMTETHSDIPRIFFEGSFDHIIILSQRDIRLLANFVTDHQASKDRKIISLVLSHCFGGLGTELVEGFLRRGQGITIDYCYKLMLLGNFDILPEIPDLSSLRSRYMASYLPRSSVPIKSLGNRVLFFPRNNTSVTAPQEFWVELGGRLTSQGVAVDVCTRGAEIGPDLEGIPFFNYVNYDLIESIMYGSFYKSIYIGGNGLAFILASLFKDKYALLNILQSTLYCTGGDHRSRASYERYSRLEYVSMFNCSEHVKRSDRIREWNIGEGRFDKDTSLSLIDSMLVHS